MTSKQMSSRGGKPRLRQCPASTKDRPHPGRSPGSRVNVLAPPSQFPSGIWSKNSPVTVAGTAPDFRRLPYYPRSRADLVRARRLGPFLAGSKPSPSMPRLAGPLHAPEHRAFGHVPAVLHLKAEALIKRDIMFVGGFKIGGQAVMVGTFGNIGTRLAAMAKIGTRSPFFSLSP